MKLFELPYAPPDCVPSKRSSQLWIPEHRPPTG